MSNPDSRVASLLTSVERMKTSIWDVLVRDPYVTTGDKDNIMRNMNKIVRILQDAERRSRGDIPTTPDSNREARRRQSQYKKMMGVESLIDSTK
jgi:hypothetical protein